MSLTANLINNVVNVKHVDNMRKVKGNGIVNKDGKEVKNVYIYAEDHKILSLLKTHYEVDSIADVVHRVMEKAYEEIIIFKRKSDEVDLEKNPEFTAGHDITNYPPEVKEALKKKEEK